MDTPKKFDIVAAFWQLVKQYPDVFTNVENLNLSTLITALKQVENQPIDAAAATILAWSQNYQSVLDEIVSTEREKNRMGKRQPEKQDATLNNSFPTWEEDIKQLDAQQQTQNQTQTDSN